MKLLYEIQPIDSKLRKIRIATIDILFPISISFKEAAILFGKKGKYTNK